MTMTIEEKTPLQSRMDELDMTPEEVSAAIRKLTKGEVTITAESVRNWTAGRNKPAAGMAHLVAQALDAQVSTLFPAD